MNSDRLLALLAWAAVVWVVASVVALMGYAW